ncbi:cell shape-determining protein [Halobiforma lacisalsi AJ5]|uniref:Cell shape-determining protein n=1 Tax=Natronobacterium lacisalsi AJ5 TaxID=358396 RepID=M0LM18_NATLA|nr:PQQ-binding-like beta-propeller repeat protein [Halobiforma lacisalsi]APW98541.1 cell shape-determining protein [Halobiforma lacisalsi AJ5]EMA33070.1 Pyrrolo-quinoline quinone repeat-containing protein [Halobiforma lacisalsi AJ5]
MSDRSPIPRIEDETDRSRRQFLRAAGVASAAGLAGCATPWTSADGDGSPSTSMSDRDAADTVSAYASHPDDDVRMFQRGLRRLGYYPDEVVPDEVSVNWSFPINNVGHTAAKSSPVPTPDGDTMVMAGDTGWVHGVEPSGEPQWLTETGATKLGFHGSPAIVDGTAYIGGYDGDLYAIDVETGELVWRTRSSELDGTLAIGSSPAYYEGTLYVIVEYGSPSSGALWTFDAETGEPTWSDDRIWGQSHPSPTIDLETGRICAGSNDGAVYCWEFPSLEFAWKFQTGGEDGPDGESKADGEFNLGAEIKGTIAAHDGYGYFGSWDEHFYCLDLEDGTEQWSFETDGRIMANPALDPEADVVYTGSNDGYVYALDCDTGEELWATDVNGSIIGALTVTAGSVLVGSYDSYLYALDAETGTRRWRVENRGHVTSAPVPHDGRIYYAERGVFSNYWDDEEETILEEPGHAYCLVPDE